MQPERQEDQPAADAGAKVEPHSVYGPQYYRSGCGPIPYERNEHWTRFFGGIADEIIRSLNPRRVFDAGCAMGFLVDAWGVDISPYAISQVRGDMAPYCHVGSLTEPIQGRFDLITCIEVLEHMEPGQDRLAIENMSLATDTVLFSSTPSDFAEATHINIRPLIGWLKLFTEFEFWPDSLFDAGFVTSHAMLLRRTSSGISDSALALFAEMIRQKMIADERARRVAELNQQTQDYSVQLQRLTQALDEARAKQKEEHDQADRLARENAQMGAHVEAERTALRAKLEEMTVQFAELHGTVIQLSERVEQERELLSRQLEKLYGRPEESKERNASMAQPAGLGDPEKLRREVDRLAFVIEHIETRLRLVRDQAASAAQEVQSISQSRIWRVLCAGGAGLLSLGSVSRRLARRAPPQTGQPIGPPPQAPVLHCDDPPPVAALPRSGIVPVKGWAVGAERVELQVDGGERLPVTCGLFRPDVKLAFPHIEGAAHAGFQAEIDSSRLSNGPHSLAIRAIGADGAAREIHLELLVDHARGFESEYDRWIKTFETRDQASIEARMAQFSARPLVSVVVPVYKTVPEDLERAVASVLAQSYPHWELCLADDGSESPAVEEILRRFAAQEARIKVAFRPERGGIAAASNSALAVATGDLVAFLDHDDELTPDALFHVVDAVDRHPEADLLYSDQDKITPDNRRFEPFFKPDWSPDLLLSSNYICHLLVARRSLVEQAGGFRSEYDGSQDYDLILRLSEKARQVVHIPMILYHWRATPESVAGDPSRKKYALETARLAIADHLRRRNLAAQVVPAQDAGRWRVRYLIPDGTSVSIIIPSGGNLEILSDNLNGIARETDFRNYELIVVDNSRDNAIRAFVNKWKADGRRARCIDWRRRRFNYSAINNEAARQARGTLLLFLNDDTRVIAPGWLTAMVELAARPEVGAVGAKLLYPTGLIQHAGVVLGIFENCGHAFKAMDGAKSHYFGLSDVIRNVSAVTGACLMVRPEVFWEVGGFDEEKLAVAFNDIDLCLRIGRKGYRVLYTPHALLYHRECGSKTVRDVTPSPAEVLEMQTRWRDVIAADPFYSPNLSRTSENFSLREEL